MARRVTIVGAGIVGAASAYQLSKRGFEVTIVDAGNAGASEASFGWINANYFTDSAYFKLRVAGIQAYRDLSQEIELPINWQGCLCWEEKGDALTAQANQLAELGYDARIVDSKEFARLEPNLKSPPEQSLYFQSEAAAETAKLAAKLLQASGAKIVYGVIAEGFLSKAGRVTGMQTNVGDFSTDQVLVCAGTGTQALMALGGLHLPMLRRPGLMITTKPIAPMLNHILASPEQEFRQLPNGSLLAPAAASHQSDDADEIGDPVRAAEITMDRLSKLISNSQLELQSARLAFRPVPQDGLPAVGLVCDGLYVATMHSGVTLAAVVGDLIAQEIEIGISERSEKLLSPYRPTRF